MFVSKAAVVGGGTMGGEIAQAIAAADIPVVVKDIDQKFVDAAVEKARAVTEGQLSRLVKKEKLSQERADARLAEVMGLITGTTDYADFGDVDFVVEAVPDPVRRFDDRTDGGRGRGWGDRAPPGQQRRLWDRCAGAGRARREAGANAE